MVIRLPFTLCLLISVGCCLSSENSTLGGGDVGSSDMSACRSALASYSGAMGDLQSCVVVSILPSDICQNCLLPYLGVIRQYKNLDQVRFSERETCKQLYVNSAHFLTTDSYMFTHTYEAAVNSSSPFLRGNCQSCYVQSQNLTVDSQLREEVETYLQMYLDVKLCFMKWEAQEHLPGEDDPTPVCKECSKVFEKSQTFFKSQIMGNSSSFKAFSEVCLDISDRYQELNHFYEKFHCKPNANTNPLMGFEFVFGAIFLVAATFFYSPSLHAYKTGLDKKWNCNVLIQSQCSSAANRKRRITSTSSVGGGCGVGESEPQSPTSTAGQTGNVCISGPDDRPIYRIQPSESWSHSPPAACSIGSPRA